MFAMIVLCFGLVVFAVIIGVIVYLLLASLVSIEIFLIALAITTAVCITFVVVMKKLINKKKQKP